MSAPRSFPGRGFGGACGAGRGWRLSVFRGFLAGASLAAVLAGIGFVGLSLTSPLPEKLPKPPVTPPVAQDSPPASDPAPAVPSVAEAPAIDPSSPEVPVADVATSVDPEVTDPPPPAVSGPQIIPDVATLAPLAPVPGDLPGIPQTDTPVAPPQAAAPDAPLADLPQDAPSPATLPSMVVPAPPVLPGPVIIDTPPVIPPQAAAEPAPQDTPAVTAPPALRPQPGLNGAVEGVRTGRLPTVGGSVPEASEVLPTLDGNALQRNARPFANPDRKPPFAILLLDTGDASVDLGALAAGDLPLTLVIDPAMPGASARAELWRAAGQEVALLSSGVPTGGGATDMEVAMEALAGAFPQALALVDPAQGGLQGDRGTALALIPSLKARGFGMVTWDRGLNAADQVARREGVAAGLIFRELDEKDETAPVIRRYLDRAAFKAQQDGRVAVMGRLRPETLAAIAEWSLDSRADSLAPAPLSALVGG